MSDRKQEVVDVAKKLFAERGIRHATVRDIGASAGILSGSLYHHFSSKDDLVDHILRDFCKEVLARYDKIATAELSSADKLRTMARFAFSLLNEKPEEIVIVADEYVNPPKASELKDSRWDFLVDFNQRVGRHWYDALESGVASGELRSSVDPRALYRLIRDAIMGAIRWWEPSKMMSTDQVADALVDIVLNGIVINPPAAKAV